MNNPNPMPNPVPAVTPPIMGPAISYSVVRGVINSGQTLEKSLESKIRNSVASTINHAAGIGAGLEARVLNRINDRLEPVKSTLDNVEDLVRNSIAGQMAPAAAYLQDNAGGTANASAADTRMGTAGPTETGYSGASTPYPYLAAGGVPPPGAIGTGVTRRPPLRQSGLPVATEVQAASPPAPTSQFAKKDCTNIPPDVVNKAAFDALTTDLSPPLSSHHVGPYYNFFVTPNCCLVAKPNDPNDPVQKCSTTVFLGSGDQTYVDAITGTIQKDFKDAGIPLQYGAGCAPSCLPSGGGVDTIPITPPTCPTQPCVIDVTCPPPVINVPPCPPCPPLDLPQCIQVDLCDWDKFCKFIKDCLTQSKQDCALDNETAYVFKDCDGSFGEAQQQYWSHTADRLNSAASINDAVQPSALQQAQQVALAAVGRDLFADLTPA